MKKEKNKWKTIFWIMLVINIFMISNQLYIFYTLNEKVENELVKMYVSEVSDNATLSDKMTDEEWTNIKGIMKSILTANNNDKIKYLTWEA